MPSKNLKPEVKKAKIKAKSGNAAKKIAIKKIVKTVKTETKRSAGKIKAETKIPVSKPVKATDLSVSVLDLKGKTVGKIELPAEIFGAKINNSLMSQAVRVYLANQRQGTVKTKDRGEVNRTTKKIYQQKGTGRARHGSRRAPIFVGGGRVFGPTPRDLSLNISKKMKTLALFSALSSKLKNSEIKVIKGLEEVVPKTKIMVQVMKDLKLQEDSKVLLVLSKPGKEFENIHRASRNIEGVEIFSANMLNAYKVLDNTMILLMKDSVDSLRNTFIKK